MGFNCCPCSTDLFDFNLAIYMDSPCRRYLQFRAVNVEMKQHKDGGWFIRLPGLKYDDFNRAGLPNIVKVDRIAEVVRVQQVSGNDLSKMTLFIIGQRWTFTRKLYERVAVDFPMTMRCTISGLGKSTYDTQVTYWEGHGDEFLVGSVAASEPLASVVYRGIHIDSEAYRPSPLPTQFVELLSENLVPGGERYPKFVPPTSVPEYGTYTCRIKVRYDDMDMLFHTNHSAYLAFALECATQAAESGFYSNIRQDVAFLQVKTTTSIYMGESRAGNELDVSTWEDEENKLLLNFVICKDGAIIYYAQVEYYDKSTSVSSKL